MIVGRGSQERGVVMTAGTVIVSILLICVVALAIRSIVRQKKAAKACGGCQGGCIGCTGCHSIAGGQAKQLKSEKRAGNRSAR